MRESVRYHNVADVEVGSFLSSGIDSSYMAACLASENPDIKTFTVLAEYEGERDEITWRASWPTSWSPTSSRWLHARGVHAARRAPFGGSWATR